MSKLFFAFLVVAAFVVIAAVAWFVNHPAQVDTDTTNSADTNTVADSAEDIAAESAEDAVETTDQIDESADMVEAADDLETADTSADATAEADSFTLLQFESATATTSGDITTYTFSPGNTVSIMPSEMQSLTLSETPVQERTPITIGSVIGERLTITSAKDGSALTIVQVIHADQLFDFRGAEDYLANLADYIQFN